MLVLALVGAVLLAWGLRSFVVATYAVPSGSMAPLLQGGDRILVDRVGPRLDPVRRGDVVVFEGSESFGEPGTGFVKRVVGVGGDRVACCDDRGRLTVNGTALDERRYLGSDVRPSQLRFDVEVPRGRYWVMGDNRTASRDSRAFLGAPGGGTVAEDDLVGRVVAVVWPYARAGRLP